METSSFLSGQEVSRILTTHSPGSIRAFAQKKERPKWQEKGTFGFSAERAKNVLFPRPWSSCWGRGESSVGGQCWYGETKLADLATVLWLVQ